MKFKVNDKEVVESKDLDKVGKIHTLSMSMDGRKTNKPPTLEDFQFGKNFFPTTIKQMQQFNADECTINMDECGKLLNYNIQLKITDPTYKTKYKFRITLRKFLEKYNIIK